MEYSFPKPSLEEVKALLIKYRGVFGAAKSALTPSDSAKADGKPERMCRLGFCGDNKGFGRACRAVDGLIDAA